MDRPANRSSGDGVDCHAEAASAFVRRVKERRLSALQELYLFGSTPRGEATGLESDVDFLAVVSDSADRSAVGDELRDVAYDVMLEYGPVVEVHVFSQAEFTTSRNEGHPFIQRVVRNGESHV